MKKFFEKNDLFKLAGIFVIISLILTWIIGYSYYSSGELITEEINRAGLFDLTTYGLLGLYYFTVNFIFLFIVGGFYKFLGNTDAYKKMTDGLAKLFTGKEKLLVIVSTVILAALASISSDYFVLIALVPLVISVLSKLKVDKLASFSATFGAILAGVLGATYSAKIVGMLGNEKFGIGITYGDPKIIWTQVVLLVIAVIVLIYFALTNMNKKGSKDAIKDIFAAEVADEKKSKKVKNNVSIVPLACIYVVTMIILLLAFVDWTASFGVNVFTDFYTTITEATIANQPIFAYILGKSCVAFGSWDLITASGLLVIAAFIIKLIYHIPFDKMIEWFGEGFKTISKTVVVLLTVYLVLELNVIYPVIPYIADLVLKLGSNCFTLLISAVITSAFVVDFQYVVSLIGSAFANFDGGAGIAALALQTGYGIVGFIAPTSAILMAGLSMLNIKFSEYFKFIWKFLIAIIVVVIAILVILTLV